MKFKTTFTAIALLALIVLTACSGALKDKEITASNVSVTGDAKDLIKVVDGTYTLKAADNQLTMTVEIELLQNKDLESEGMKLGQWTLNLLDANGAAIPGALPLEFQAGSGSEVKIMDLLKSGILHDKNMISFSKMIASKDDLKRIMKEAGSIELNTVLEATEAVEPLAQEETAKPVTETTKPKPNTPTTPTTPDTPKPPVQQSEDWDKLLGDFETAVDRYIVLKNAAKPTDPTSVRRMNEQMKKVQDMMGKLNGATDMTGAQSTRFSRLKSKLENA
jgi:hypothetical protein